MFSALFAALIASQTVPPAGWHLAGSDPADYIVRTDRGVYSGGRSGGYLGARPEVRASGFGTLMQSFRADDYRGKRLRLRASVRLRDVRGWAGLWMRIDGPDDETLGFDNMQSRPLQGTNDTWRAVQVVLDVPTTSESISFGILLSGTGETWIDDIRLEEVDASVPVTGAAREPKAPRNLDFEE